MVTIVSWNTLESGQGGAWADGWGCPLEIQRWKEELVQWKKRKQTINTNNTISSDSGGSTTTTTPSITETEAAEEEEEIQEIQRLLTNQRYARIRNTLINEMNDNDTAIDFYLFQELTEGNPWDEYFNTNNDTNNNNTNDIDKNDNDHRFEFESESESEFTQFPPSTYERVPCQEDDDDDDDNNSGGDNAKTVQRIYVRTESGWKSKRSYTLHSEVLEGGCLVEFQQQQSQPHSRLGVDHGAGKDDDNEDDEDDEEEEQQHQQQLFLVNLHGNSKKMRDPHLRRRGLMELWKEIGSYLNTNKNNNNTNEKKPENKNNAWGWWMEKIIVCGDFNTHLSELIPPTRHYLYPTTAADSSDTTTTTTNDNNNNTLSGSSSSPVVLLEPVVGLLRNSTTTSTTGPIIPVFSTNHEDGFLAQYDGCIFFRHNPHPNSDVTTATTTATTNNTPISSSESVSLSSEGLSSITSSSIVSSSSSSPISSSYLELENVSRNLTGFMPKGHGKLPGRSSSEQQQEEHPYYNNFTYHSSHRDDDDDGADDGIYLNGIFLGSGTVPSFGMSDHLRIYTTLRIHNHHHNHNNDHPIKEQKYQYEHQRRPPRHYSDTYN